MPSFAWKLTDPEIAAVVTYVRNTWGNATPPVAAGDVGDLRAEHLAQMMRAASLAVGLLTAAAAGAARADPQGLSPFVPVETEDALAVRLGELDFQGVARFTKDTHNSSGGDLWNWSPEVKLGGPVKGLELIAGLPYATGNQSGANQGSGHFVAFYQFNDDGPVPAGACHRGRLRHTSTEAATRRPSTR